MFKIITKENLDSEHICCAISNKHEGIALKKAWLEKQLDKGLVFRKLDARGKVFIEYIPAEYAFAPVEAPNYLYINCFWVSGKFKKQGYGKALLEGCLEDAKRQNKSGVVVLSSKKKKPFLSDPKFLKKYGFKVCDTALDYELLYYPLKNEQIPAFLSQVGEVSGHRLYYSHQCPHTEKYVRIIEAVAKRENIDLEIILIDHLEDAKKAPCPFTTYSLYLDGKLVTNEIMTEKKFLELIKLLE